MINPWPNKYNIHLGDVSLNQSHYTIWIYNTFYVISLPRYGVIHGTGEMELQPLEKHVDEDEEDIALFDVKDSKRPKWSAVRTMLQLKEIRNKIV